MSARRIPDTKPAAAQMPAHVVARWRRFSALVDEALAADLKPWTPAETACASIAAEWGL